MPGANICPPGSFNVPTQLLDTRSYAKKLQESTDPAKYVFDTEPGRMCFMNGEALQGFSKGTRLPPPHLVDVESYLRTAMVSWDSVTGPINEQTPNMPEFLARRLDIPECNREIDTTVGARRLRSQMPTYSPVRTDIVTEKRKQVDLAREGRNTKQELKDAYKRVQEKKFGKSRSEGIVVPSTFLDCDLDTSTMGCVHVSVSNTAGSLGNTKTISGSSSWDAPAKAVFSSTLSGDQSTAGANASVDLKNQAAIATGTAAGGAAGRTNEATLAAVRRLNQSVPFSQIMSRVGGLTAGVNCIGCTR
jgi:hypothetical protein